MAKTRHMREIETERGQPIELILDELFRAHQTQQAVANDLGISQGTLNVWLLRLGLEQRTIIVPVGQLGQPGQIDQEVAS